MPKLLSVQQTINAFYECADNKDIENMCDYFETLLLHYKQRGKLLKKRTDE